MVEIHCSSISASHHLLHHSNCIQDKCYQSSNEWLCTCESSNVIIVRGFELFRLVNPKYLPKLPLDIVASVYGIWNLDFFRTVYTPFCLHPEMTNIQALALDYVIAVYPLILIALTYILVELHDWGFRPIMWLWRPFHRCFGHFRRQWDIRTSLLDAFATFLLLSYIKLLSVSFDLLFPVSITDVYGHTFSSMYLYFDATV